MIDPLEEPTPRQCLNCDFVAVGSFCPHCGQAKTVGPLRVREILGGALTSIVALESPILRTTWGLLRAPGRTASDWIGGQRKRYTNPVQYYVILGVIFTMLIRLNAVDAPTHEKGAATYQLSGFVQEYIAFVLMIIAIPFAPVAGLLSRWLGVMRSAVDWYVLFLYCLGISLLILMGKDLMPEAVARYWAFVPVVFLLWGSWQFDSRPARSLAVGVLTMTVWFAILAGIR